MGLFIFQNLLQIKDCSDVVRVAKVTDVVKEGDEVKVKVIGFDRGKVKLSIKQKKVANLLFKRRKPIN